MMPTDATAANNELSISHQSRYTGEGRYPRPADVDCPALGVGPGLRRGGEMEELR